MKKFFAMLLVLLVCAMALPLQALAVSVPQYIASIGVAYGRKESTALDLINDNGYTLVKRDLNDGAGGYYVYMGYKTTTDPNEAITGILIRVGKNPPDSLTYNGCTFYLVGGKNEPNGTGDGAVDLNEEAKGDYLYTYITRDLNFGNPLISLQVTANNPSTSGYTCAINTNGNPQNLNSGAGGYTIYLSYEQFEDING